MRAKDVKVGMVVAVRDGKYDTARRAIVLDPALRYYGVRGTVERDSQRWRSYAPCALLAVEGTRRYHRSVEDGDHVWKAEAVPMRNIISTWDVEQVRLDAEAFLAECRSIDREFFDEQNRYRSEIRTGEYKAREAGIDFEKQVRVDSILRTCGGLVPFTTNGWSVSIDATEFRRLVEMAR